MKDGIDHINIYSSGATKLGRLLSNFAHTPFTCEDGAFESVEGYWYWLGCRTDEPQRERLRKLWGLDAKLLGRELCRNGSRHDIYFKEKIKKAIRAKIESNDELRSMLAASTLPFDHYYVYDVKMVRARGGEWVVEYIEELRKEYES